MGIRETNRQLTVWLYAHPWVWGVVYATVFSLVIWVPRQAQGRGVSWPWVVGVWLLLFAAAGVVTTVRARRHGDRRQDRP